MNGVGSADASVSVKPAVAPRNGLDGPAHADSNNTLAAKILYRCDISSIKLLALAGLTFLGLRGPHGSECK